MPRRTILALPVASLAACVALAACAPTPTVYAPAGADAGGVGYDQIRIENDRWRVSFNGGPAASPAEVERLALRRAAEITLQHGQDWFRVVDRRLDQTGSQSSPVRLGGGVGLGVGSSGFRSSGVGLGLTLSPSDERRTTVTLEILTGGGDPRPDGAFDAATVLGG